LFARRTMKFDPAKATSRKIGLALSGGGSRAIAFHLGCLRALHQLGLLDKISALSCVSGGSVIGAYLIAHDGDFDSFEKKIREVLAQGFVGPMVKRLLGVEGLKILAAFALSIMVAAFVSCIRAVGNGISIFPFAQKIGLWLANCRSPMRRFASRTTLLERALDDTLFERRVLSGLPDHPNLIINATELRTGSSFRFGTKESGSWRWGRLKSNSIPIAHAVAASAAYPLFLPAFDELLKFENKGREEKNRVILTDGGVYDNLGVSCFWPDRSPDISLNVDNVDTIVCCSAGYRLRHDPPSQFLKSRMMSVFSTTFDRAQNASIQRLHDLRKAGEIKAFLFPYLGQLDHRVPNPPADLIRREDAHSYPTDFNAMPREWIDRLSLRGEQLTICLAREYIPNLISQR
jgi:NTE family protein